MQIPMAYKVESYKESLFMGFPLRQSLHMIAGMVVMAVIITILTVFCHIYIVISMYAALPFAAPIVIAGFPDDSGMTKIDIMLKKREIKACGRLGRLTYGTGLNEELLRRLEKTDKRAQEDVFDRTIRKMIIAGILAAIVLITLVIFIIIRLT